jgi:hypothetical protein
MTISGEITNSSASGNVAGSQYVGGIFGGGGGQVNGVTATGDVEGYGGVGGIAGYISGPSVIENSIADNKVSGTKEVGAITSVTATGANISNVYYNQDKNPDLELVAKNEYGTITGVGGGLSTEQLADGGIQDAIVSGGDVADAVANHEAAQAAPPAVDEPVAETPPTVDEPVAETPPTVNEPVAETPPPASNPPVAQTPANDASTSTPPIVEAPVTEKPVAEATPPIDNTPTPPVAENTIAEAPPVVENPIAELEPAHVVDLNAAQTIAALIASRQAQAVDVLPAVIRKQTGNLGQAHIPLEQLMAHLSNASAVAPAQPASAPASETPKPGFDSNVNNIVGDGECLATDGSCGNKK